MALLLRPPTEREALPDQLADLGRARKRVAVAAGVFALVGTAVGIVTVAGILDAALHLGALARALVLVLLLVACGVVWVRGVARAFRYRTDALAVALELEDRFPLLNDALASAVSFLGTGDEAAANDLRPPRPKGVSNRLTAAAVRAAERKAGRVPLDSIVPTGRCWRAFWLCFAALAVAVPLSLWNSARAATVVARIADPFGAHPWPTKTQIAVLSPEQFPARVAKGEPFEMKFAVRGHLVGPARVQVRVHGGSDSEEAFPLAASSDPKHEGAAVVTVRFDPARVSSSFAVRVLANDAETDWLEVTVVPPPRLVPLDGRPSPQFHATPPAYTNVAPGDLAAGAAVVEVPTGTALKFRAATDVKVSAAVLVPTDDRSAVVNAAPLAFLAHTDPVAAIAAQGLADRVAADIPVTISGDGTRLSADFLPTLRRADGQPTTYALKLTDETGLTGTVHLKILLTADPVPVVTLVRPQPGFDPPVLTPTASLTVRATATDNQLYGVRDTFIEYRVGRDGRAQRLFLSRVPNVSVAALAGLTGAAPVAHLPQSPVVEVARTVPVAAFLRDDGTPVREGDLLIVRAAADDWDDVNALKGPGRSVAEMEIRVASAETIEAWLQKELAGFRPELVRLREQQREAKQKVLDVAPLPGGAVSAADRDKLVAAEQIQKQVRGKVGDARDGLRARAELLRATVAANGLPKSPTTDRVDVVATELGRTADRDLGTAEQHLADAKQLASQPPQPGQEGPLADHLRRTARHQKNVEDTATALLDLLSQWGGAGEIRGEARALRDSILRQLAANERLRELVKEGKPKPTEAEQRELDRAADKADQAATQASELIARAAKLAGVKDAQAADLRAQADAKDAQATELRLRAADTTNPVEKSALAAQADAAAATATDLRAQADRAAAEAAALRKGITAAEGDDLPADLRRAADRLRKNQQSAAGDLMRGAVKRLDGLAGALAETDPDAAPELAKKPKALKGAADQLDALANAQEELRKRAEAAAKITDPQKRQDALKELAKEQDQLIERGRELLQKLTRDRADDAARDARAALDRMEAARDDLEKGLNPNRAQADAVERLDAARDRLDAAAAQAGRQLSDEKRRKLADQVKALVERQRAAVAEAKRVHAEVARAKGWDRALLTSYSDLESVREKEIAVEVRKLGETEFAPLPVLARLLRDSAAAIDLACERVKARCDSADLGAFDAELEANLDRKVLRPMELALRRLEQLADALKPDDPKKGPNGGNGNKGPNPGGGNNPGANPGGAGGGQQDLIPPLAQLKVLRALQAELNERTAQFAKDHPDVTKLTKDERAELKELEDTQREITELFEKMAQLFDKDKKDAKDTKDEKNEMPPAPPKNVPPAKEKP
jgi:hypothetical protein